MKQIFIVMTSLVLVSAARAGESLSLAEYLKQVESENLLLRSQSAGADAANAKSVGVALPEPMVGLMTMQDDNGSARGIEISQTVPFPTKLTQDRRARKLEAEAEKINTEQVRKEVLAQARLLYFGVWAAQSRIELLKEKRSAIKEHLRLSTASTRSDASLRIHTLKAESDYDMLESEIIEAEQVLKEKQIQLASFVQKDPSEFKPDVSEPPLTKLPALESLSGSSGLESRRLTLESLSARESVARASWFPDLTLRYRQLGSTGMTPGYREVMLGFSLPFVFPWTPNSQVKSAEADRLKADAEYRLAKTDERAKTLTLNAKATALKSQIELIQSKLLPRAEKRMRLVHNLAPRDMESLQEHREGMETFPELKLKALELRMQYEETAAMLAALTSEAK